MNWFLKVNTCCEIKNYFYLINELLSYRGFHPQLFNHEITRNWDHALVCYFTKLGSLAEENLENFRPKNFLMHSLVERHPLFRSYENIYLLEIDQSYELLKYNLSDEACAPTD